MSEIKVGCIGCGTMGGALIKAMAKKIGGNNIYVSSKNPEHASSFAKEIGVNACQTNVQVAEKSDYVFIGVKPAYVESILDELNDFASSGKVFISMAAGISLETLQNSLMGMQGAKFVRIMPNLPAVFQEGMTAICYDEKNISAEKIQIIKKLLETAGKAEIVPEKLMDAVTAVSGSGPAYAFMFIEALADAAVRFGMPRKQAYIYAAQTLKGAAVMALKDERSISQLKDAVCSPAGTTIEAVVSLEKNGFRSSIIEAASAAYQKSLEIKNK